MTNFWRPCCVAMAAGTLLAACSGAGATSTLQSTDNSTLVLSGASGATGYPETVSVLGEIPVDQLPAFEDGKISLAEYQQAFGAFAACAKGSGVGGSLREISRDNVTGLIQFETDADQNLQIVPGVISGSPMNICYQSHFAHTKVAFELNDPAVLAANPAEQLDFFNENVRPCLEQNGVTVPSDLEYNDSNWVQLQDEYGEAVQDGRCETTQVQAQGESGG